MLRRLARYLSDFLAMGILISLIGAPRISIARDGLQTTVPREMTEAAEGFLNSLSPELRKQAVFEFGGSERKDWHFVPKERVGVKLKDMTLAQRRAAHTLLKSALSEKGYLKATAIMNLEQVLRVLEADRPGTEERRDQEKYWFAVFGAPKEDQVWGWRLEGHHLSLNFSSVAGLVVSTPLFLGANPAEVKSGPRAGLRVLGAEEDLARSLIRSMNAQQRAQAIIATEAPRDVITVPGHAIDVGEPAGLPFGDMEGPQRKLLMRLVRQFAMNLRPRLAQAEMKGIRKAGHSKIRFAWAGSLERGQGHYFRIHGPQFIIEYDNTQNDANHAHAVWHSVTNDFAVDTLRRHYAESPHHKHP